MSEITYPTRCQIVNADGLPLGGGLVSRTPDESVPHIGKCGLAEYVEAEHDYWDHDVRITLDDGNVIYGYECWWIPL